MHKEGVSPVVGTILLVAITVALAAVIAILVSGLGGQGAPTITVWSSFENKTVPEERSYVAVNDELKIGFNNFSDLPIKYKIVLVYDGNIDNIAENQIYSTLDFVEIKCSGIGEMRISTDGISRAVEIVSPFDYDAKEIAENILRAQEGATRAEWIATILGGIAIVISIVFGIVNYRRSKAPKSRKK